ncbi:glutamate receptor ionotropic, delta-1-like [Oratosquilla oratoria]|uniref:glutamate receptor ionotropic, delta-1-like n=1 Tax=Oratosquilla oratoria TaxID=337810 RepID=UPI003F76C2BF
MKVVLVMAWLLRLGDFGDTQETRGGARDHHGLPEGPFVNSIERPALEVDELKRCCYLFCLCEGQTSRSLAREYRGDGDINHKPVTYEYSCRSQYLYPPNHIKAPEHEAKAIVSAVATCLLKKAHNLFYSITDTKPNTTRTPSVLKKKTDIVMLRILLLTVLVSFLSPRCNANSDIVTMLREHFFHRGWNHLIFAYTDEDNLLTKAESHDLVADLARDMAVAFLDLDRVMPPLGSEATPMLSMRSPNYQSQFAVAWDTKGGRAIQFLIEAGRRGLYTDQQEWLIILPKNVTMEELKEDLSEVPAYVDSELVVVTIADGNDNELEYILTELWRSGRGQAFLHFPRGLWSPSKGLVLPVLENKYDRRKDMMGFHLRVATIITMPYESLTEDKTLQNLKEGYVVDVWHTLQQQLNFTYTATNTLFGSLQADGVTWNGMVGMLQTDDADVAVAPLSITKIRSVSIDFTIPIQIVSTRLYIRRPVLEATWALYGMPFGGYLWLSVPFLVLVCALMTWSLNRLSNVFGHTSHGISPGEAFWIMFSGLMQQSSAVEPKPASGKIVFFMGFWAGMILFTCYSAILVSILTTMQPQLPFKNFEGLLESPDWNLGVRTNTALADALALAPPDSPQRLAWQRFVTKDPPNNLVNSNDQALANVLKGKYAFFANKEYIIYRLQRVLPLYQAMEIVDTKTDFLTRGIGFGLQKGSPYRKLFNHVLTKMTQSGHLDRIKKQWWPHIDREPETAYPSPGFKEVFTVFLIWGVGILLSFSLLGIEKFIFASSVKDDTSSSVSNFENSEKKSEKTVFGFACKNSSFEGRSGMKIGVIGTDSPKDGQGKKDEYKGKCQSKFSSQKGPRTIVNCLELWISIKKT